MPAIPSLPAPVLQKVADIIGDTEEGLTGSEIGRFLAQVGIADSATSTKRHRVYDALSVRQRLKHEWALLPLRVRRIERVRLPRRPDHPGAAGLRARHARALPLAA